jgi:chemotaxis protein methyltransferase CheR
LSSAPSLQAVSSPAEPPDPGLVRLRDLIYEAAGIYHPDNKFGLLQDRCFRRMRELEISTLPEYLNFLTSSRNRQPELIALLNEITIGETCFFRNLPQLEALRRIALPNILSAKLNQSDRRVRIWSAGCSTGEEPYSLRMLLLEEAEGLLKNWDIEILATDINQHSLAQAQAGIYSSYRTRNLPPVFLHKYFLTVGEQIQVAMAARANINFERLNLSDDMRMSVMQKMDVIFCCNVLIYFDLASKRRVLRHFYNHLLPHGYLFLGSSESLYGVTEDFSLVHLPGATAYVKRRAALVGGGTI